MYVVFGCDRCDHTGTVIFNWGDDESEKNFVELGLMAERLILPFGEEICLDCATQEEKDYYEALYGEIKDEPDCDDDKTSCTPF